MTKQLQVKETSFTEEQIKLIKNTIAKGATDDELQLFLYQARRTGLDPLSKQIYFIKRAGQSTIQTSIDGFRVLAERSGKYAGQDRPLYIEKDGRLVACEITVYRFNEQGTRYPAAVGVAYMDEYRPPAGQDFMWKKMPRTMLSKTAESLALRKAFPQDLAGLYTEEEMQQEQSFGNEHNISTEEKEVEGFKPTLGIGADSIQEQEADVSIEGGSNFTEEEATQVETMFRMGEAMNPPITEAQKGLLKTLTNTTEKQERVKKVMASLGLKDIRTLSKREATQLIGELLPKKN